MAIEFTYRPIGVIHTPFKEPRGTPIQPTGAMGVEGTVEVSLEYSPGLMDFEGFSHVIFLTTSTWRKAIAHCEALHGAHEGRQMRPFASTFSSAYSIIPPNMCGIRYSIKP